jgi:hypothetical protein
MKNDTEEKCHEIVLAWVKKQSSDVTAWKVPCPGNPSIYDIRVFNWTSHTLIARGITWKIVAEKLNLIS